MASLGSYRAPIQTQCQYPTLKRDPLVKVKHSPVWGGSWFCFHYTDISKAASPVTFLGKKLPAWSCLQGVISHGVISIIFYLFVCCLPVPVNASRITSPPPRARRALPAEFWDAAEHQSSQEQLSSCSPTLGTYRERAGEGRGQAGG